MATLKTVALGTIMASMAGTLAAQTHGSVTITIVYDNVASNPALSTDWGFACLVETPGHTVLFDTGGDGRTLMANLAALGRDPRTVEAVVLSHEHGDHTGGLAAFLAAANRPRVVMPDSFPEQIKDAARAGGSAIKLSNWAEVAPGIIATGAVGGPIPEQALIVATSEGIVVITGCAHPGIVAMVRRGLAVAEEAGLPRGPVTLAMGGFHLRGADAPAVSHTVEELRALGVQRVAPSHCTGDGPIRQFAVEFGEQFLPSGAGWTLTLPLREAPFGIVPR